MAVICQKDTNVSIKFEFYFPFTPRQNSCDAFECIAYTARIFIKPLVKACIERSALQVNSLSKLPPKIPCVLNVCRTHQTTTHVKITSKITLYTHHVRM